MVSPQQERLAIALGGGYPPGFKVLETSIPVARNGRTLLADEAIWKRLCGSGFPEDKHRDTAVLVAYTFKLEAEIDPGSLRLTHTTSMCVFSREPPYISVKGPLISSSCSMAITKPLRKSISCVILDLDGTLLNTDGIVSELLKALLVKYGKPWDGRLAHRIVGKTPMEAAAAIVEDYKLPSTVDELIAELSPMFSDGWCNIKPLPGASRLIKHLNGHGVPMALVSDSPRTHIEAKISYQPGWNKSFSVIIGGDEVRMVRPSPEIFLEAAKRLNSEPSSCLVIEDSLPGVTAGKAAGMEVVAVPSLPKQSHLYSLADEVINSLLDLQPEKWGLLPFEDWLEGTLPIEPWHIGGPVIKGFGRGSKVLGIPTANLSTEGYLNILSEYPSGIYFGWAGLSTRGVYKMVMSIGWNPYFNNTEKTIEPWLLNDFGENFYGEELRLTVVGYIRPEANFPNLESLIAKIHEDRRIAEKALDLPLYARYKKDPYLSSSLQK